MNDFPCILKIVILNEVLNVNLNQKLSLRENIKLIFKLYNMNNENKLYISHIMVKVFGQEKYLNLDQNLQKLNISPFAILVVY